MFEFIGGADLKDDLEQAGIEPAPSTLRVSVGDPQFFDKPSEPRIVAFDDATGRLSVGVTQYDLAGYDRHWVDHHVPNLTALTTKEYGSGCTYRGLLPSQRGVYAATINADGSIDPDKNQLVKVEISPTAQTINELQERFGRHPGHDAFQFARISGGHFSLGQYDESFARMRVPLADLEHWSAAYHDTEPGVHINTFMETSPWGCRTIASQGQQLVSRYGDMIHAPKDQMPKHIREGLVGYGRGLEYLNTLGNPVHRVLVSLGNVASQDPSGFSVSESEMMGAVDRAFPPSATGGFNKYMRSGFLFGPLGLVPGEFESDDKVESFSLLLADRIGSVGHLMLALEDIRRPEGDTDVQLEARMRVWQTAANMAGRVGLAA